MTARTLLDDMELPQAQCVDVEEEHVLAGHAVPALEGDFLQRLQRRAARVSVTGVLSGEEARDGLGRLRERFRAAEPVDFVADLTTAVRVGRVLIEHLEVRELAGMPERFEYALALRELIAPPRPTSETPPPRERPPPPAVDTGTLVVEVTVEGEPEFEMSRVTVTADVAGPGGGPTRRTLTERTANVWTLPEAPPGAVVARAVSSADSLAGEATGTVSAGQTTRLSIVLRRRTRVALGFVVHFRFDSAFVEPCMRPVLARALASGSGSDRLLVVGHTDRVGPPGYNQSLSERRARAVYAFLTFGRDPEGAVREWTALRQPRPAGGGPTLADRWGVREYQQMLQDLGWYPGEIDGNRGGANSLTNQAIRAFRCRRGLPPGTQDDDVFWDALIRDYLAQDAFALPESRLLPNCPGEPLKWLGCGEEDPIDSTTLPHRPNRRVELLLVPETALPCPVPQPDTFHLPPPDGAGTGWCVGGPPAASGHFCFLARPGVQQEPPPAATAWTFQLAEPATVDVVGRLSREVRQADGSVVLEPVPGRLFVAISPGGEFRKREVGRGEPDPDRTLAPPPAERSGTFDPSRYAGKPEGTWTVEVRPVSASQPVLARLEEDVDGPVDGAVVCRRLGPGDAGLHVVIVAAPAVREIRIPAVAHLLTALDFDTREVRACPTGPGGAPQRQASSLTDDDVRAAFAEANRIWRQGRIRFELVDVVREAWAHPISPAPSCEMDHDEFRFLLSRCAYPGAVNVLFAADLAGSGEAGFGVSVEGGAADGISGCAVGERFTNPDTAGSLVLTVTPEQRAQVLAHELGHYLDLPHPDESPANQLRLMNGSGIGVNRRIDPEEVDRARASRAAADDCTPLSLRVDGAARVGGTLSHRFVFVRDPASPPAVTVDAEIPEAMLDPARGTLVMAGGAPGATPLQQVVPTGATGTVEVTATYTPVGGTPVVRRVFVHVVDLELAVDGAVRVGATSTFFAARDPVRVATVRALLAPAPFCVPDTLVAWTGGSRVDDPLRVAVSRAVTGTFPVTGAVAGIARTVTVLVGTLTLRVEGDGFDVPPGAFATPRRAGATLTVVLVLDPAVAPPPAVAWVGATPTADPLRATFVRTPAGARVVSATVGDTTVSVQMLVMEVAAFTQVAPAGQRLDLLSDPAEPVLRMCLPEPSEVRVDVTPDTGPVFHTTAPAAVVDLTPTRAVGDAVVRVTPRPFPAGTDRVAGRETRLTVRVDRANGPAVPRAAGPEDARIRIRIFEEIVVNVFLHVVRNDDGTHPAGVTLAGIIAGLNASLDTANRIWRQACVRFRMRQRAGTAPRDRGYTEADLEIDFIDATERLDITATFDPVTGAVTTAEEGELHNQGGIDRNGDNPTFINFYVIERFDGAGTLGGIGGGNRVTYVRTELGNNTLFAHEVGHCLNLGDLDETTITDIDQRLMRSATPRGDLLASGGVATDEIRTARGRAGTFTG